MATITDLANAIAQMEGYNTVGSIAQRNNNPGNLRYAPNQIGSENTVNGTFATFASASDGWQALQDYIASKAATGETLRDFIYSYAPPSENNTSNYLNYLSSSLGLSADSSLGDLVNATSSSIVDSVSSAGSSVSDLLNNATTGIDGTMVGIVALVVVGALVITNG